MNVLVTDPINERGIDRLRDTGHDIRTEYDLETDELLEAVADIHALVVRSGTEVTREVIEAAPELIIIGRAGIGTDNIDEDAATEHGVIVANAPQGNVRAAAEHTVAMTFAAARWIPQADRRLRAGDWAKSEFIGMELNGKTLGIVGLGRVGQEVARRLGDLGMEIVAYDPYISADRAESLGAELVDFETCLDRADVVSVHVPLTPETEGLIGAAELERLEDGLVINCSRGSVVDEDALAAAVSSGSVRGAALDVFSEEPLPADSPLLEVDDIVVTPHLGASTEAAQENVATSIADQVIAAFDGEPVVNALNAPSIDERAFPRLRPFIDLATEAGRIATQLLDDRIERVTVEYLGEIADEDVDLVTASALMGVFEPLEWQVNAVNAPRLAEERGVEVTESKRRSAEDFTDLIRVRVGDADQELTVEGTLFAGNDPRIVRIDGYRVDAIPAGHMLICRNRDRPGILGLIGTALGENEINIAGMFNSRESSGGEAMTVYNLDDPVPQDLIERLESDERIISARYITLN